MNILFSLEPLYELNRPFIMDTWLQWFARMHTQLKAVTPDYEARLLAFDSISFRKNSFFHGDRILLSQAEMRDHGTFRGNICRKIERGVIDRDLERHICHTVELKLDGFVPDTVVLLNNSPWLRKLFPKAIFLYTEVSWLHRPPYPIHWQINPLGLGKGKVLEIHHDEIMSHMEYAAPQQGFVDVCKRIARSKLGQNQDATALIASLRERFRSIVLLPLADRPPLDGETPMFAWIDLLLDRAPGDTIYIVTQHPMTKALE